MNLVEEIEISYFRSFYKFKLNKLKELNIIFGKNDSGKSNIVRALSLFFSGAPDHTQLFDFGMDFCDKRRKESEDSDDVRKFLYVKITFNTPKSYQPSLGRRFYVKRQWTVSRGTEYHEEMSADIPANRRHIASRLLNKIKFIYVPAIKDIHIFEMLLFGIYETLESSPQFGDTINAFSRNVHTLTGKMFESLPRDVCLSTRIAAPTKMSQLFQTLDFETTTDGDDRPKSLTRQRGDGIKVRHIPELLSYISENDKYNYHIWGFEEPENSLDFVAAQAEANRILKLAKRPDIQIFITTHSPSFYLLEDAGIARAYVTKNGDGLSEVMQSSELKKFDAQKAIGDGFYLPAVAEALANLSKIELRAKEAEERNAQLMDELNEIAMPVVLTEGRTDAKILLKAWDVLRGGLPPFKIRSCETGGENAGSGNGGAQSLAIRLKGIATDHPHAVIGLFDLDAEGVQAFRLDRNFSELAVGGHRVKRGIHGKSYAALLPAPDFRAECASIKNMPIEFLFRDEDLAREIGGKRLRLEVKKATVMIGDRKIERTLDDVTHFKDVRAGKTDFAEVVVPALEAEAFAGFECVFALIESLIAHSKQ